MFNYSFNYCKSYTWLDVHFATQQRFQQDKCLIISFEMSHGPILVLHVHMSDTYYLKSRYFKGQAVSPEMSDTAWLSVTVFLFMCYCATGIFISENMLNPKSKWTWHASKNCHIHTWWLSFSFASFIFCKINILVQMCAPEHGNRCLCLWWYEL